MAATLGLFFYEIHGVQKRHALIEFGEQRERSPGMTSERLINHPHKVLYLINEPFATGVIYSAVLAGWMLLALATPQRQSDQPPTIDAALKGAIWVFIVGFLLTLIYNLALPYHEFGL